MLRKRTRSRLDGTQIAIMSTARQRNAPRKGLALGALVLSLSFGTAHAGSDPQLTLPLVAALALSGSAQLLGVAPVPGGRRKGVLGLLPKQLDIPDGYAVDPYRDPPRYVTGVDRDKIVGFDLFGGDGPGFRGSLSYDQETRGPFGGGSDLMRFILEYRF